MRLKRALLCAPAVPAGAALALSWLLVLPGDAGAASSGASAPGTPSSAAAVPALGAASAPLWRAPGIPSGDDWDDLDAAAAQAEAAAQPAPVHPPRPVLPASAPRPQSKRPAEEPSAAKSMAKSALGWLKELLPWAFSSDDGDAGGDHAAPREIVVTGDMLLGTPQDVIAPGAGHRVGGTAPPPPVAVTPTAESPDGRRVIWGTAGDPLQEAIALLREVARHPMTWLLIALAVLGRLVIWLLARPTRSVRVLRRRRRRRHHR